MEAGIGKEKRADRTGGYPAINFGKTDKRIYGDLVADHPIDWTRWQVVNCYMGRSSLINSGGDSKGQSDLEQAVRTAVINKRAGGSGPISGRKTFQRPLRDGVQLVHALPDLFRCPQPPS